MIMSWRFGTLQQRLTGILVAVEQPLNLVILPDPDDYDHSFRIAAVKLMRSRIRLPAQPKSMRSIIDATQREQRHGSAKSDYFMT
jgi:hypothetical protein